MLLRCILICCYCCLAAQAEQIQFELGGASQSVGIVEAGHLQTETTLFNFVNLNKNSASLFDIGETTLRYGLITDKLEIRTRLFGLSIREGIVGVDNLSLGTKVHLLDNKGLIPTADLIIDFKIPVNNDINSDNFTQTYNLTTDNPINSRSSISSNLSLVFASTDSARGAFNRSVVPYVIGFNAKLTDKLSLNHDLFGTWSMSGELGNSLGLASYATYYFQDNLAGVITTIYGLNDNIDPFSVFTGLVYRF